MSAAFTQADAYERYMGRWSRQLAPAFLRWLNVPQGHRWLDVGCGTGALSAAVLARAAPTSVTGVDASEALLRQAQQQLGDRVLLHCARAEALPLGDRACDASVAALVLNFVPDPHAVVREMVRVTAAGGVVAAYAWDYAGCMDLTRTYWQAAREDEPTLEGQDGGPGAALCRPEGLMALFEACGLGEVRWKSLDLTLSFVGFDDYWMPFLGGQGAAPAHAMSLPEASRTRLRERLRQRLCPESDGPFKLKARAWAVQARC